MGVLNGGAQELCLGSQSWIPVKGLEGTPGPCRGPGWKVGGHRDEAPGEEEAAGGGDGALSSVRPGAPQLPPFSFTSPASPEGPGHGLWGDSRLWQGEHPHDPDLAN